MSEISIATAVRLRRLRDETGVGLMDASLALTAHPNFEDAKEHLRTLGQAVVVRGPVPPCGSPTCKVGRAK